MTDIDWNEQPTPEHVAATYINPVARNAGIVWWVIREGEGYGNDQVYFFDTEVGQKITIHHKPKPKVFEPAAGEWCEAKLPVLGWCKVFIIGKDVHSQLVYHFEETDGSCHTSPSHEFRPIKSDRELFIEKAREATGAPYTWNNMFELMYRVGFKAPSED